MYYFNRHTSSRIIKCGAKIILVNANVYPPLFSLAAVDMNYNELSITRKWLKT